MTQQEICDEIASVLDIIDRAGHCLVINNVEGLIKLGVAYARLEALCKTLKTK